MGVQLKRVYDAPSPDDGYRVLVDRLWPRGVRKDSLVLDQWDKQVAPSAELRRAYHHHDLDDAQFRERYLAELDGNPDVEALAARARTGPVTLLFAARDVSHTHARVLAEAIAALM